MLRADERRLVIQNGPDLQGARLIRAKDAPEVYFVATVDGRLQRRHVVDEAQLYAVFGSFDNVEVLETMGEVNQYPLHLPLSSDLPTTRPRFQLHTFAGEEGEHVAAVVLDSGSYQKLRAEELSTNELVKSEVYTRFKDDFDFILLVGKDRTESLFGMMSDRGVRRGCCSSKLRAVMTLPDAKFMWNGAFLHEVAHTWGQYIVTTWGYRGSSNSLKKILTGKRPAPNTTEVDWSGDPNDIDNGHWGISDAGGELGGYLPGTVKETALSDGRFRCEASESFGYNNTRANLRPYSLVELWLMGLATGAELSALSLTVWEDITGYETIGGKPQWTGRKQQYDAAQLQALGGAIEDNTGATFRVLILIVTDELPTLEQWKASDAYARWFSRERESFGDLQAATAGADFPGPMLNFSQATRKRARMNTRISGWDNFRLK